MDKNKIKIGITYGKIVVKMQIGTANAFWSAVGLVTMASGGSDLLLTVVTAAIGGA